MPVVVAAPAKKEKKVKAAVVVVVEKKGAAFCDGNMLGAHADLVGDSCACSRVVRLQLERLQLVRRRGSRCWCVLEHYAYRELALLTLCFPVRSAPAAAKPTKAASSSSSSDSSSSEDEAAPVPVPAAKKEIGRASCRERVS